jgi:type IV pilus assembly protein PilA
MPQYSKFQAKARQSEAKITLGSALTAQRAYQVEAASFTSCLSNIGVAPPAGNFFYTFGFNVVTANTNNVGTVNCSGTAANGAHFFTATANVAGGNTTVVANANANVNNSTTMNMGASGRVSTSGNVDTWMINENGTLTNVTPAL